MAKLLVLAFAISLAGCAAHRLSNEQYAALSNSGDAFSGLGRDLKQQQNQGKQQSCTITDLGGGQYLKNCR